MPIEIMYGWRKCNLCGGKATHIKSEPRWWWFPKETWLCLVCNWFKKPQLYVVQSYKDHGNGMIGFGGTHEETLKKSKEEMKRLLSNGYNVSLHTVTRIKSGGIQINYPPIEEHKP